ncbi:MAG TPA: preprotein translocase subunit SecG [Candidatus Omnitrophica bacterium]|nr:preprotein translocase subunit SecG [Candidatus Omnitrophota bacterium]
MYGFLIVIHVMVCVLLVAIVLIQSGRGGGLTETFSSAESIFGTKTSAFLTRATTVLAILFITTCLSLYLLSIRKNRSLMRAAPQIVEEAAGVYLPGEAGEEKKEMQANVEPIATETKDIEEDNAAKIPTAQ